MKDKGWFGLHRFTHGLAVNLLVAGAVAGAVGGLLLLLVRLLEWPTGLAIAIAVSALAFPLLVWFFEWVGDRQKAEEEEDHQRLAFSDPRDPPSPQSVV